MKFFQDKSEKIKFFKVIGWLKIKFLSMEIAFFAKKNVSDVFIIYVLSKLPFWLMVFTKLSRKITSGIKKYYAAMKLKFNPRFLLLSVSNSINQFIWFQPRYHLKAFLIALELFHLYHLRCDKSSGMAKQLLQKPTFPGLQIKPNRPLFMPYQSPT